LPGAIIDLPSLTDQDEQDINEFGKTQSFDMICASLVRKASDIEYLRGLLGSSYKHVKIIAKIENHEGLQNFEDILSVSDGIMVTRRKLAMELPPEKVYVA